MTIVLLGLPDQGSPQLNTNWQHIMALKRLFHVINKRGKSMKILIVTAICIIAIIIFSCMCGITLINKAIKCFKEIF